MIKTQQFFRGVEGVEVKSALPRWVHLTIRPDLSLREKVVQFLRLFLSDLPNEVCEGLGMALHELLGNAIEHGARLNSQSAIDLTYLRTSRMVLFEIRDNGAGFSLENMNHAALNNPPNDPLKHIQYRSQMGMRPGGFGIMVVRQIADDLIYSERGNEVALIKYLD